MGRAGGRRGLWTRRLGTLTLGALGPWAGLALIGCSAPEPDAPDAWSRDAALVLRDGRDTSSDTPVAADAALAPDAPMPDGGAPIEARRWEDEVVYFVLTDRFVNGDAGNDGDSTCTDPLSPRLFHGGDLPGLRAHLDHVTDLGATALWITPVQAQVGRRGTRCGFHGYWADLADPDDQAIEPRLGGATALDELLATAHARGMRVMADVVVNHAGYGARLTTTHPDWFHDPASCASLGDPTITCPLANLPDLAQERPEVASYLVGQTTRFLERFPFDALRVDTVKHVPPAFFRDAWIPAVYRARGEIHVIGELFEEGRYEPYDTYLDAGFDGLLDFVLRRALVDAIARRGSLDAVATAIQTPIDRWGIARARVRGTMVDNHDVSRFLSDCAPGMSSDEQRERLTMALGVIFTSPGVPYVYYGTELGTLGVASADDDNRRDLPGWALGPEPWPDAPTGHLPDPARTRRILRALSSLRASHSALRRGGYAELWRPGGGSAQLLAYFRSDGESRVLVAINGGETTLRGFATTWARNPGVPAADRDAWRDGTALVERLGLASEAAARVEGGRVVVDLAPRAIAVFTGP